MTVYRSDGAKVSTLASFRRSRHKPHAPCISFNELLAMFDMKFNDLAGLLHTEGAPKAVLRSRGTAKGASYYVKQEAVAWLRGKLKEKT